MHSAVQTDAQDMVLVVAMDCEFAIQVMNLLTVRRRPVRLVVTNLTAHVILEFACVPSTGAELNAHNTTNQAAPGEINTEPVHQIRTLEYVMSSI